jgi:pentapeptide MXKDX repeat protein
MLKLLKTSAAAITLSAFSLASVVTVLTTNSAYAEDGKDAGSKDAGSKDAGSKDAGSKDAGSKDAGSKDAGSKDAGSKDAGSKDAGSKDGGTRDKDGTEWGDKPTKDASTSPKKLLILDPGADPEQKP